MSAAFTHHPVPELLQSKQQEFYTLAISQEAKSVIQLPELQSELSSILKNAPNAFMVTLLRPHLLEAHNSMMLLSALENAFILILLIINIYFLVVGKRNATPIPPLIFLAVFFVIITFCLIGLVTPVLGAVVRYKVAALPFLLILLFYQDKWKSSAQLFNHIIGK